MKGLAAFKRELAIRKLRKVGVRPKGLSEEERTYWRSTKYRPKQYSS